MKSGDWDEGLLAEHRGHLQADEARAAFDTLTTAAVALGDYDCAPGWHGVIRDFRYVDRGGSTRPFAFIVNRDDLLFYVRRPGFKRVPGGFAALRARFEAVRENPSAEWTVRIRRAAEARALSALLFGAGHCGPPDPSYWWVNHGADFRDQTEAGYLWCAKSGAKGAGRGASDSLARAVPGDVVFSFAEERIGAIGVVMERVRSAPAPAAPGAKRAGPAAAGWLLPVRFAPLTSPLVPREHLAALGPVLPPKHSPLRANGERNPALYLAAVPARMAAVLRELLAGQLEKIEAAMAIETDAQLLEAAVEEHIWRRTDLGPREKRQLLSARLGQGVYRQNVEGIETFCRVTGVPDRRHLRVSHIKPWRLADDREKLDAFNGLLLSPHAEHLFNRGHISFADDGQLLISKHLNPTVAKAWGLDKGRAPRPFRPEQRGYLDFHRRHIFEKVTSGRRG